MNKLAAVILATMLPFVMQGQNIEGPVQKKPRIKWADMLFVHCYAGATASLCKGDYIDYHKSFIKENIPNITLSGEIKPVYFFSAGLQVAYMPFYKESGPLSNLGIGLGIGYARNGFSSTYNSEYKDPNIDITDRTVYKEKFLFDNLVIPITIRYGKRVFAEVGFVNYTTIGVTRKKTIEREVSGSDAYQGGFETRGKVRESVDKNLLNTAMKGFLLGGGVNFRSGVGIRAQVYFYGKMLKWDKNITSISPQLQILLPLYEASFTK